MSPKHLPQTNSTRTGASGLAFSAEELPLAVHEAAVYLGVRKQILHLGVMGRNTLFLKSDLAPFRAQFRREVVMSRPRNHDGRPFQKEESKFWWMDYREHDGKRQRESTNNEDWEETQKRLRGSLQARDRNTLAMLRKGEQLTFAQGAEHFLEAFSNPPIRTQKTHHSYARVAKHLNARMGEVLRKRQSKPSVRVMNLVMK